MTTKVKTSDFDSLPARDASIFLIDGSSLAYRSFFALPAEISTSTGQPTNALLGFSNMLLKLITDFDPTTVIVAWDVGGETVRKETYAEYKSHRPEMPDPLSEQWPFFKPLVEAFGFTNVEMQGYEADDVIGTLSSMAEEQGLKTCIVTYDRDAMQLVSDKTVVMMTTKGVSEVSVFTPERVKLRYGVRPDQIADFIALRGDTSDNIPGVPGIGDKTAAMLLEEFGSLDNVLSSTDKVSGAKRRENLEQNHDQAVLSRELATIVRDLPLEIDIEQIHAAEPDRTQLVELLGQLEFRTLTRRVMEMNLQSKTADNKKQAGTDDPMPSSSAAKVAGRVVSIEELTQLVQRASDSAEHGIDVLVRYDQDSKQWRVAAMLPNDAPDGGKTTHWVAYAETGVQEAVRGAVAGSRLATFDFKTWHRIPGGGRPHQKCSLVDDLQLTAYLLEPGRRTLIISELTAENAIERTIVCPDLSARAEEVMRDVACLPELRKKHHAQLNEMGMMDLYQDIELPLVDVLEKMEEIGVLLDPVRIGEIALKVKDQLIELNERAWQLAGEEFNLGSPQQLATILFEKLSLPAARKGKTGYSTDRAVLRELRDSHPIIPVIEKYRELSKLMNTYLEALPELVDPRTKRIHTTFSQVTAATGRLSSVNPNMQNIPVRTALGREIRSAFIPADGFRFVSCDYSQVELRLLAHVSQEPTLIEIFRRNDDVHRMTAAELAGCSPAEVTKEQRDAAKAVNFGIIYGISSFGLASQLQISRADAQNYIDRYLGRFPQVGDFIERTIEAAKRDGYVTTLFGRRRPVSQINSRSFSTRQLGERLAVNTVLQGTAADIMKLAMVRVHRRLQDEGHSARIVLQIHDELLLEVSQGTEREIISLVKEEMAAAFKTDPPLVVDAGSGESWLDAK